MTVAGPCSLQRAPAQLRGARPHYNPACLRSGAEARAPSHHRPRDSPAPSIPARPPKARGSRDTSGRPGAGPGNAAPCGPARVAVETGHSGSRGDDGGRPGSIPAGSGGRQGAAEGRAGRGRWDGTGARRGAGRRVRRTWRGEGGGEEFSGVQGRDRDQGQVGSSGARRWRRAGGRGRDTGVLEGAWGVEDECRGGRQHKAEPATRGREKRGCIGWMREDSVGIAGWQEVTGCSRLKSALIGVK